MISEKDDTPKRTTHRALRTNAREYPKPGLLVHSLPEITLNPHRGSQEGADYRRPGFTDVPQIITAATDGNNTALGELLRNGAEAGGGSGMGQRGIMEMR